MHYLETIRFFCEISNGKENRLNMTVARGRTQHTKSYANKCETMCRIYDLPAFTRKWNMNMCHAEKHYALRHPADVHAYLPNSICKIIFDSS